MSKKNVLNDFFNQEKNIRCPVSNSDQKPEFKKRKLFDDPNKLTESESIIELDTNDIYISPHKVDRLKLNYERLESLATNMVNVGQLQPCTVRHNPKDGKTYELIFGERRYRAAILKNLKIKSVIKDIDLHTSALLLLSENKNREDNTDYALYQQIHRFINDGILKQTDIVEKTGISKQKISKLMCFAKIPEIITNEINDLSNISATTAEVISNLSKDKQNIAGIIKIKDKIEKGVFGHTKITNFVKKYNVGKNSNIETNKKHYSKNGRHLFTVRKDNNNSQSIHFPKDILKLLISGKIKEGGFYEGIKKQIENTLNNF